MIVSYFTQILGLACLSFVMNKHFKAVFKKGLSPRGSLLFKISGWILMTTSLFLTVYITQTLAISIIYWLAFLSGNILLLTITLSLYQST
jgi:hypothetical protein